MTPIMHCFLFLTIAHQHEQDPTHTSDDETEAALDVARPFDAASERYCPQHTYLLSLK